MIDYEVRYLTKNVKKALSSRKKTEPILIKKISSYKENKQKYINYFKKIIV